MHKIWIFFQRLFSRISVSRIFVSVESICIVICWIFVCMNFCVLHKIFSCINVYNETTQIFITMLLFYWYYTYIINLNGNIFYEDRRIILVKHWFNKRCSISQRYVSPHTILYVMLLYSNLFYHAYSTVFTISKVSITWQSRLLLNLIKTIVVLWTSEILTFFFCLCKQNTTISMTGTKRNWHMYTIREIAYNVIFLLFNS